MILFAEPRSRGLLTAQMQSSCLLVVCYMYPTEVLLCDQHVPGWPQYIPQPPHAGKQEQAFRFANPRHAIRHGKVGNAPWLRLLDGSSFRSAPASRPLYSTSTNQTFFRRPYLLLNNRKVLICVRFASHRTYSLFLHLGKMLSNTKCQDIVGIELAISLFYGTNNADIRRSGLPLRRCGKDLGFGCYL
jgi:hypothetical protein